MLRIGPVLGVGRHFTFSDSVKDFFPGTKRVRVQEIMAELFEVKFGFRIRIVAVDA